MVPVFDDLSGFDHEDAIGFFDGLESVSDDDNSAVFEEFVESERDGVFRE